MEHQKPPKHLFKVMTLENWEKSHGSASLFLTQDDEAFIHFSTDEQVERIINKFFSNEKKIVLVVVDTGKLPGKLVFEANPGGSSKYYHLYGGSIPWASVVEERIVERKIAPPGSFDEGKSLKIFQTGERVLRAKARPLEYDEIKSAEVQDLIGKMQRTMRAAPGVGLAAPQIGYSIQLAVIEDRPEYHSRWTEDQLQRWQRRPIPFHVIINPTLTKIGEEQTEFFEGCLSVPSMMGLVQRAASVRVDCLNEKGEPIVINATGWYARILQHEIDHLNGTLYWDRADPKTLMTLDNFLKHWKDIPVEEAKRSLSLNLKH